ncbi:hypothetical protein UA08_01812 [Talaromyces atroroseus]|uniref:Uncharacterized protein n=1 Tax=Talaromyces atroroseus TaxID=1441469 RepID=A0A1Q5QAA2_TALAT|nr:hypothetical protein UA08_01812 [Talaromyces atroroseus]OKL62850.1 hypothetical protein UA08_01812 [Talaromyces atroroseus]
MSLAEVSQSHIQRVIAQLDKEASIDPKYHITATGHGTLTEGRARPKPEDPTATRDFKVKITTDRPGPDKHHSPENPKSDGARDYTVVITAHLEDRKTRKKLGWAGGETFELTYILNGNKYESRSVNFYLSGKSKKDLQYRETIPFPFSRSDSVFVYAKLKASAKSPVYFHPNPSRNDKDKIEKPIRFYAKLK